MLRVYGKRSIERTKEFLATATRQGKNSGVSPDCTNPPPETPFRVAVPSHATSMGECSRTADVPMPQARCFFVLTQGGGQHLGVEGYREKGSGGILQALTCIFSSLKAPWWQMVAKVSQ